MNQQLPMDILSIRTALSEKLSHVDFYPSELEQKFPRIITRILALWGEPELDAYLDELILPSRPGRQGFPYKVASEIFTLSSIHASITSKKLTTKSIANWTNPTDFTLLKK